MNFRPITRRVEAMPKWQLVSCALVAIAVIGVVDHATGPVTSLSIFYLMPVAACAWFVGSAAANVLAFLAAAAWALSDRIGPLADPTAPFADFNDLSLLAVFIFVNLVVTAFRAQVQRERDLVLAVQKRLLPDSAPQIGGFDISWCWVPAWTVAGDYYDMIRVGDDRYAICVGDVSGKGMAAALIMANVQATIHVLTAEELGTQHVMTSLNGMLSRRLRTSSFVTMFYALLETGSGRLSYTNAGHNPPIVVRSSGEVVRLQPNGPVAGIFPHADYGSGELWLAPGDDLVIFSDGVTEYENRRGEEFGETRLEETVLAAAGGSAQDVRDAVISHLKTFSGGRPYDDDVTLLIIRRCDVEQSGEGPNAKTVNSTPPQRTSPPNAVNQR